MIPHIRAWLTAANADVLVEPFAGGAIVSLTAVMEGFVRQAILVEIDRDVAAFWHAALRHGAKLADAVQGFKPTRRQLRAIEKDGTRDIVELGFRTLVLNRTRNSGILAPGASFTRNGENGRGILSRWYPSTLAKRLSAIEEYADRITFCEADGVELLDPLLHGWGAEAAVFIDPPYTFGGKRAGTRLYAHTDVDHERVFEIVAKHNCNFLMTYDQSPEIEELIRSHGFSAATVQMKNAHHNPMAELLITREPLFA